MPSGSHGGGSGGERVVDLGIEGYEQAVEIGRGGFAIVYRAWQPTFQRHVAIKLITTVADQLTLERFRRECLAVGALSGHPNIVTVHGLGRTESDQPYIVMEFLSGGTISDGMAPGQGMAWADALAAGVKLSGALEAAHRAGVLHRDVKPSNILVSRFAEPKLADFGIARMEDKTSTGTGVITATFAHAAPEIISGQQASVSTDVYSLGSTLFELLHGRAAFVDDDSDGGLLPMLARIGNDTVPDLRPSGVPPDLCTVIEQAMAKDAASRPGDARDLGHRLQATQERLGLEVTPLPIEGEPQVREHERRAAPNSTVVHPVPPPPLDDGASPIEPSEGLPVTGTSRRRRRAMLAVSASFAVVLAAGAFLITRGGGPGPSGTTESTETTGSTEGETGVCDSGSSSTEPSPSSGGSSSTTSGENVVFADDFSNRDSGWEESSSANGSSCYASGEVWSMAVKGQSQLGFSSTDGPGFPSDLAELDDVRVGVNVLHVAPPNALGGVMCHADEVTEAFYIATVDANGQVFLGKKAPSSDTWESLGTRTTEAAESHRVQLDCSRTDGDALSLTVRIDGEIVIEKVDDNEPLPAGSVGLCLLPQSDLAEARFDNFEISRL